MTRTAGPRLAKRKRTRDVGQEILQGIREIKSGRVGRRFTVERMRKEYDFSKGKRGAVIPTTGKTRITIYLDDELLQRLRVQADQAGTGYQTLINEALKAYCGLTGKPADKKTHP